jgi:protocatechuate 3,4-dioxygenase alpha subunit
MTPNFAEIGGVFSADLGSTMINGEVDGRRINISVRIFDGAGAPVNDAVVEIWQADGEGSFVSPMSPNSNSVPAFTGWGRQPANGDGVVTFETIKPGSVSGPDDRPQAPHVLLWIVARGINIGLQTRLYFGDEADANAKDYVLNRIPDPRRRQTLIARTDGAGNYVLDVYLQGENETVFFDV